MLNLYSIAGFSEKRIGMPRASNMKESISFFFSIEFQLMNESGFSRNQYNIGIPCKIELIAPKRHLFLKKSTSRTL